jgi:hypothetical protein
MISPRRTRAYNFELQRSEHQKEDDWTLGRRRLRCGWLLADRIMSSLSADDIQAFHIPIKPSLGMLVEKLDCARPG